MELDACDPFLRRAENVWSLTVALKGQSNALSNPARFSTSAGVAHVLRSDHVLSKTLRSATGYGFPTSSYLLNFINFISKKYTMIPQYFSFSVYAGKLRPLFRQSLSGWEYLHW